MNNYLKNSTFLFLTMLLFADASIGFLLPTKGFAESMAAKDAVTSVTEADFKTEVLQSKVPVLVDFYATWCIPCRLYSKVVDQAAQDYKGKLKVVRVDVDKNPKLVSAYNVEELPTTQLIKNGSKFKKWVGALEKSDVETNIDKMLNPAK
jgi:thioredoxin 1